MTDLLRRGLGATVIATVLAFAGCRAGPEEPAPGDGPKLRPKVRTAEARVDAFFDQVEALGTVRALEAIDISSNVTERVAEVSFEDGERVSKGDLLVRLEDAEELASLEAAKAEEAEQEREIRRLEGLVSEGAVSEVRLEEYRTRRDIARQRVEEARAQIEDRRITAPFDGVLGFREVSPGALVTPGDLIATLDLLDPVKLDFSVPETFLSDLGPGLEIVARTEAYPETAFAGTVTRVDTRVNPVTRSVTVRAEIPNPDGLLRPGMLMTTTLAKNPEDSLRIPERAVVAVQSDQFVFVVTDPGGDGAPTVARTPVTLGRRVPGYVEVVEGLEAGARVVTDGLIGLADGAAVEVTGVFEGPAEAYRPSEPAR